MEKIVPNFNEWNKINEYASRNEKFTREGYVISKGIYNGKPSIRIQKPDGKIEVMPDNGKKTLEEYYDDIKTTERLKKGLSEKKPLFKDDRLNNIESSKPVRKPLFKDDL